MGAFFAGWDPAAAPTRGTLMEAEREEGKRKGPRAARPRRQLGGCPLGNGLMSSALIELMRS